VAGPVGRELRRHLRSPRMPRLIRAVHRVMVLISRTKEGKRTSVHREDLWVFPCQRTKRRSVATQDLLCTCVREHHIHLCERQLQAKTHSASISPADHASSLWGRSRIKLCRVCTHVTAIPGGALALERQTACSAERQQRVSHLTQPHSLCNLDPSPISPSPSI